MKRIALMVAKLFYMIPVWFPKLLWYGSEKHYNEEKGGKLIRRMAHRITKAGRITIEAHGTENLPEKSGYVIFPNHQGLFDSIVYMNVLDKPFSLIAKMEVKNVILLKQAMAVMRAKLMERDDLRQSMKVIMEVTKEVKEGRNYVIFPEGTRCKEPNTMYPFKAGTFKTAMSARAPIVPSVLLDSYKAFDSGSAAPITIRVFILPPLYYEDYKGMKTVEVAREVQRRIQEKLSEETKTPWKIHPKNPEEDGGV